MVERATWLRRSAYLLGASLFLSVTVQAQGDRVQLRVEPGLVSYNFVSRGPDEAVSSGFNFRMSARIRTSKRWLTPLAGASVTPFGTSPTRRQENTPVVFVGNDFPLLSRSQTGGWVSVTVPLMLEYRYDGAT